MNPNITHGIRYTYLRYKCRCDKCTEANRLYMREWAKRLHDVSKLEHGRYSTYVNYACRCEPCKLAGREWNRKYYLAHSAAVRA